MSYGEVLCRHGAGCDRLVQWLVEMFAMRCTIHCKRISVKQTLLDKCIPCCSDRRDGLSHSACSQRPEAKKKDAKV